MRRLAVSLVFSALAVFAAAQTPGAYLKLRAKYQIVQAVVPSALHNLVGTRVWEIQGKIVGSCRAGDTTTLLVQLSDGDTQEVDAKSPPSWLADTTSDVRLLVRCSRASKGARITTELLDAALETDVLKTEEAYWRKLAASRRAGTAKSSAKTTSRSRYASNPLSGPIGRGGSVRKDWVLPRSEVTPYYAAFIRGRNPHLTSGEAYRMAQGIVGFSIQYNVDARLVMAMIIVESGFDPNAVSRSGAVGLGQLMPGTARWMGVQNSYDPVDNLSGMVRLLRTHMNEYRTTDGSNPLVLAAYNAGSGAVARHGGVPPYRETQAYVRRVTAIYARLCGR